jgi:hypothetical protein
MSETLSNKVSLYLAIIFWFIGLILYLNAVAWIDHGFLRFFPKSYQQPELAQLETIMAGFMILSGSILFKQGH